MDEDASETDSDSEEAEAEVAASQPASVSTATAANDDLPVPDITAELDGKAPAVSEDFERLLLSSPDSSYLWINYMAFHLKLFEVSKARGIAERALKSISFRENQEKFNMWVALLNLENQFGSQAEMDLVINRALRVNDPKAILIQLTGIYERAHKYAACQETYERLLRDFRASCKVWTLYGAYCIRRRNLAKARELLQSCIDALPKRKHVKAISRFGILEFKEGDVERGRTIFEGIMANYPKRTDLWSVYIDMETKGEHVLKARNLFRRVTTLPLPSRTMKFFFKKWLMFEKAHGDEDTVEEVKQVALNYVESR
ncbi:hypothetical protein BJ085DRAFT_18865 [Dimargaris cristalligena]|uniref:Pre-mRNA-splicing factor Syf1/CRNKL1-like C-terminal HAT-repeats domain-containing protein n=1 Tax=Dimargaris cristalligena TaxID=215637 RepID=A0A4P9ZU21_9FUNG|nr:hypothetical protein BJ085DRAFT_18865 [Dimargaris cristalligena]|eukprot:RKP37043.1 hypothetical protein BJ085DRAFT_18865 [Dimargaris cristalligena]